MGFAAGHQQGASSPPVHHKVRTLRHFRPGLAQCFYIAVTQRRTQRAGPNKRRVAHNKVSRRPLGLRGPNVAPLRHQGGFIRYQRARHRVGFKGFAVPAAEQLARSVGAIVVSQISIRPRQHCITAFNVAVVVHHRLGHGFVAACANVPLQVAYPQHQLGQGGGAFIQLDAQQLLGRDGFAFQAQRVLGLPKCFQLVDDFAFQPL